MGIINGGIGGGREAAEGDARSGKKGNQRLGNGAGGQEREGSILTTQILHSEEN